MLWKSRMAIREVVRIKRGNKLNLETDNLKAVYNQTHRQATAEKYFNGGLGVKKLN